MLFLEKVAIVTGSSRGIGRGIAERLAREGARVVITGRSIESIDAVVADIKAFGGKALGIAADLGYRENVHRLFDEAIQKYGTIDILVNNAAWADPIVHFLEMDEDHWDTVIRTNLKSLYLCTHRAASVMVEHKHAGSIISISSYAAVRAHRSQAAYDTTKGAMEAFTRAVALDLSPFGIRVNAVGAGAIHTEKHRARGPEFEIHRAQPVPLGRVGVSADVAGAVVFLASNDAEYITGQTIYVDGGMLAQLRPPQMDRPLPESVTGLLDQWPKSKN
ncbi:MAG: SDR family NAD(P)-dependent oxidoreductase [Casimicrobiaceae bacterium]